MEPRANRLMLQFLFEGLLKMTHYFRKRRGSFELACAATRIRIRGFEAILSKPHIIKGFDLLAESVLYRGKRLHACVEALFIIEPLGENQSL